MNKKDCESIGYILSITAHDDYLRQLLFQLDPRIEPEYIGFEDVAGRNDEVNVRFNEIMVKYDGVNWCLKKKEYLNITTKEAFEMARKEVYGEDYSYIFGKGNTNDKT